MNRFPLFNSASIQDKNMTSSSQPFNTNHILACVLKRSNQRGAHFPEALNPNASIVRTYLNKR